MTTFRELFRPRPVRRERSYVQDGEVDQAHALVIQAWNRRVLACRC